MSEKYYKVPISVAKRAGLNENLRTVLDDSYMLLSEKDLRNITLTVEEKLDVLGGEEYIEQTSENITEEIEGGTE